MSFVHCDDLPKSYHKVMEKFCLEDVYDALHIVGNDSSDEHYIMVQCANQPKFVMVTLQEDTHNIVIVLGKQFAEGITIPDVFHPFTYLESGERITNANDSGAKVLEFALEYLLSNPSNDRQDLLKLLPNFITA